MAELEQKDWTHEEIVAAGLDPRDYEIAQGQLVERRPLSLEGARVKVRLSTLLVPHIDATASGVLFGSEARYRLNEQPRADRKADLSLLLKHRLEDPLPQLVLGAPDLAIEILSPTDSTGVIGDKAQEYLDCGGSEVWIVDPRLQTITVLRAGAKPRPYGCGDTIQTELLPGFSLALDEVFAPSPAQL